MITDAKQPLVVPSASTEYDPKHDVEALPMAGVQEQLGSSPDGLSEAEAAKRLGRYARMNCRT